MTFSKTTLTSFNTSHTSAKSIGVKLKQYDNKVFVLLFSLLLLAVVFFNTGSREQYAAQSSQSTSELQCNSDANRTGYIIGCKLTNG
jgi:hypothetical protein